MSLGPHPWSSMLWELEGVEPITVLPDRRSPDDIESRRKLAHATLISMTGQDFGFNVQKWQSWFEAHPDYTDVSEEEQDRYQEMSYRAMERHFGGNKNK